MLRKLTYLIVFYLLGQPVIGQVSFSNVATDMGISLTVSNTPLGNGISFADFNNDGWDDISVCTGSDDIPRFFLNIDGLLFSEVNLNLGLQNFTNKQIIWVDYDNDGDRDLFITSDSQGNRLFQNIGNLVFEDVTISSGLTVDNMDSNGASWADVNNDGCLDLYISNHSGLTSGTPNLFYLNNCDGSFSELTEAYGLQNDLAPTFCAGFLDINNDGWLDLYVANDRFSPNFMYQNNGDGTFTDISSISGTGVVMDAMSVTVGDINNDGYWDIYVTNTPEDISTPFSGNALFLNNADSTFSNISMNAGTMFGGFAWGSVFLDIENDGDEDLYVSSSYDGSFNGYPSNALYENIENLEFMNSAAIGFEEDTNVSYGNAIGDFNNDGLTDIIVLNNNGEPPSLWENKNFSPGNYIKINLEGTVSNRDAVGAKIEIQTQGQKQFRTIICGEGYMSQNSFIKQFGIGSAEQVDYIKVYWPSGLEDLILNAEANQTVSILEGSTLSDESFELSSPKIFPTVTRGPVFIKFDQGLFKLQVVNTLGQMLKSFTNRAPSVRLDLSDLHSGAYFIRILDGLDRLYNYRIVKM
jgi:hypothetical protein